MAENQLYYGDNLDILQRYLKDETVNLVYLDPPFKSNQDYNVLFAEQDGSRSAAGGRGPDLFNVYEEGHTCQAQVRGYISG